MKKYKALKVSQPLGEFYLTTIPARVLLDVCSVDVYRRRAAYEDGRVEDEGNQRRLNEQRVKSVASFLQTQSAVLPGTLILAANYDDKGIFCAPMQGDEDAEERSERWYIKQIDETIFDLIIPNEGRKLAALVDGQHRLMGFEDQESRIKEMMLPCAVFLDMPIQEQAYVFATINFNQKPVSKSHTYELYGISLADEPESIWTPDKLAVYFSRRLNADSKSPFCGHIKVAAMDYRDNAEREKGNWKVSTATIVEGILSLISAHPQTDRNQMYAVPPGKRTRAMIGVAGANKLPLREFYCAGDSDELLYGIIRNFFNACYDVLVKEFADNGPICHPAFYRTAGVQALFCVLKAMLQDIEFFNKKDFRVETWKGALSRVRGFNFDGFGVSSGKDRSLIRDVILVLVGLKELDDVRDAKVRDLLSNSI